MISDLASRLSHRIQLTTDGYYHGELLRCEGARAWHSARLYRAGQAGAEHLHREFQQPAAACVLLNLDRAQPL